MIKNTTEVMFFLRVPAKQAQTYIIPFCLEFMIIFSRDFSKLSCRRFETDRSRVMFFSNSARGKFLIFSNSAYGNFFVFYYFIWPGRSGWKILEIVAYFARSFFLESLSIPNNFLQMVLTHSHTHSPPHTLAYIHSLTHTLNNTHTRLLAH